MTTPWSGFYDYIAPDLPGCPLAAIDVVLRQAAIAFCEQSLVWRYSHPEISIVSGTNTYDYVPPAQTVVHAITYAELDGRELASQAASYSINIYGWRNQTGTPEYVLGGATALTLVPRPDANGTLKLTVALKPSPTATGLDDDIFNEYREAIVHGALSRLTMSPKKPYTSTQLAQYHAQQFMIKTGQAGMRQARDCTRAPLITSILRRG